jgi:metal-responsive CopG/Arc/MetJ family transcriptional regulator
MVKMTFTLDEETVEELDLTAKRLLKPKSQVIREAIHDYHLKSGRLSESERLRMMRVVKDMMSRPPTRTQAEVDREIAEIRRARRHGGRRHRVE